MSSLPKKVYFTFLIVLLCAICQAQPNNNWWKHTSIYQIYPRSYMDTNGDGIGDLKGIIQQLDYIKDLGFETIWISPFYQSPQADFGYDISDYLHCDKDYGEDSDMLLLIEEVHRRDMKIVFDMVLNHTSIDHHWFQTSKQDRKNDKSDWYIWHSSKNNKPPNNWLNVFNKKTWHYVAERDQYYYTAFLDFQPDLNWRNPEVKEAMFDIVRYWLEKGVDGFRLDIFNCILEDENLQDNPFTPNPLPDKHATRAKFQKKVNNIDHPDNITLAKELRSVVDEFPNRFLIGEALGSLESTKKLLGDERNGLHTVFQFDMIFFDFKARFFRQMMLTFEEELPAPLAPTIVFGNHDMYRYMRRINNDLNKAKLLALFQMTARGIPVVYYGEEIGMTNTPIPKGKALDPISGVFNNIPQWLRNMLPVPVNRDVARTPMQWNVEENAGFTTPNTKPWLPVEDYETRNVAQALTNDNSLLNVYSNLLNLRKNTKAFQSGSLTIVPPKELPNNILAYQRQLGNEHYWVVLNYNNKPKRFTINTPKQLQTIYTISNNDTVNKQAINISALGGMILKAID